jgi:hypothetical protein
MLIVILAALGNESLKPANPQYHLESNQAAFRNKPLEMF